jgi:hypothetical protein
MLLSVVTSSGSDLLEARLNEAASRQTLSRV